MPRCKQSTIVSATARSGCSKSSWRWNRRATKRLARIGKIMGAIHGIVLVAAPLEQRWNERLAEVARLEDQLRTARDIQPPAITDADRAELLALGTDLPRLGNHSAGSTATRKRVLR